MVLNGLYPAQRSAASVEHVETDKVGVIKLVIWQIGQLIAPGKQLKSAQRVGRFFGANFSDARDNPCLIGRTRAKVNARLPSSLVSGRYVSMSSGTAQKDLSRTSPFTP